MQCVFRHEKHGSHLILLNLTVQIAKMVKLTIDLIARGTSGYTKKKRDESMSQYLRRLTHLYLEDRNIDEVVN